jgi:murein DD-endopeptidase MepM/ murein hydrolase activator NlpD
VVLLVLAYLGAAAVLGRAQVFTDEQKDLHDRLDAARAEITRIQREADSIRAQIESIDEQTAAVAEALALARELVERTQAKIAVLERRIAREERAYSQAQQQVQDVAVSLYKTGPRAELRVLLNAESITELSSLMEYSSAATQDRIRIMVRARRLDAELDADKADLEVTLAEAREAEEERERQTQHLRELREAQVARLADLRSRIEASREEAAAIQTRSDEIAQQLRADAPTTDPSTADASVSVAPASLGASGFAWPISGAITSGYGDRWGGTHQGIDIDCVTGAPVVASQEGAVVTASYDGAYGYHIVIVHGDGFATLYAHNSELRVSSGKDVSQGEVIAACGSTGQSTGDHLHFEIRVNGVPQDPLGYLP